MRCRIRHAPRFPEGFETFPPAPFDEQRAPQRFLAVRGDDGRLRDPAAVRISLASRVLPEQQSHAPGILPWTVRNRIDENLDVTTRPGRDRHQAQPEPPAQRADVAAIDEGAGRAARARASDGEVHAVGQREPIDALEHQRKIEGELQFDDHGRLIAARRDDVATTNLALDVVALPFEKRFDGGIEIRFSPRQGLRVPEHVVYYARPRSMDPRNHVAQA